MAISDLATLAQVKAWLPNDLGLASDTQLYGLITSVSRAIYAKLQRPNILPMAYTDVLPVPPSQKIVLKAWPVISISSVTVGPTTVPAANPAYAGNGYLLETVDPAPPSRQQTLYFGSQGSWGYGARPGYGYGFVSAYSGLATISYLAGYQIVETLTVTSASAQATAPYGAWTTDRGVTYASTGIALTAVTGSPTQGQYALNPTMPGGYVFNTADNGALVIVTYGYIPADLTQAAIEWVGARFKAQDYIGYKSKSLGGQETITFDTGAMPAFVTDAIQPYKRVTIC